MPMMKIKGFKSAMAKAQKGARSTARPSGRAAAASRRETESTVTAKDDDEVIRSAIADGKITGAEVKLFRNPMMRVKAYRMLAQQKRGGNPVNGPRAVAVNRAESKPKPSRATMQKTLQKKGGRGIAAIRARIAASRNNQPPPAVTPGAVRKRAEAAYGAAFDVAAAKQLAAQNGVKAIMQVKQDLKTDPIAVVANHAASIAEANGIDYDAAKRVYDAQVGVDTLDKIQAVAEPLATQAKRAVDKIAGGANADGPLAVVGESPTGRPDDNPTQPAPMLDPKILMGIAAVGLILLVKG